MPRLITPALPAGTLANREQPRIEVDAELILRPWEPRDADALQAAYRDPGLRHWSARRIDTEGEALDYIAQWRSAWAAETDGGWAVARADSDVPVGNVALRVVFLFEATSQVSYWVAPSARGQAVAARATGALTTWAFEVLRLHRLYLVHSVENPSSCRVAEKCAYRFEGTLRDYMHHTDGWHDMHLHARLATDSPAKGLHHLQPVPMS